MRLKNKVAVITGGASGIGAATVNRFVEEGCRCVIGDLQQETGTAFASQFGDTVVFVRCDVTIEDQVANLIDTAVRHFGQLDIVFNNAGIIGAMGPIDTMPTTEWQASIDVLLNGVFYGMKHAARVMKPSGKGSIINMTSTAGLMGGLAPHPYTVAKHAVIGLSKNCAAELCHFGIRVNAIAAGAMATPMVANALTEDPAAMDKTMKMLAKASPLRNRPGLAEDVANAALWLASDESGYTTGHTLTTDAGTTIGASKAGPEAMFADYAPMIREAGRRGL